MMILELLVASAASWEAKWSPASHLATETCASSRPSLLQAGTNKVFAANLEAGLCTASHLVAEASIQASNNQRFKQSRG